MDILIAVDCFLFFLSSVFTHQALVSHRKKPPYGTTRYGHAGEGDLRQCLGAGGASEKKACFGGLGFSNEGASGWMCRRPRRAWRCNSLRMGRRDLTAEGVREGPERGGARPAEGNEGKRKPLSDHGKRNGAAVAGSTGGVPGQPPHHFSYGRPEPPSRIFSGGGHLPPSAMPGTCQGNYSE
jgi:hypothetical protein